jgi:hypothetical protein
MIYRINISLSLRPSSVTGLPIWTVVIDATDLGILSREEFPPAAGLCRHIQVGTCSFCSTVGIAVGQCQWLARVGTKPGRVESFVQRPYLKGNASTGFCSNVQQWCSYRLLILLEQQSSG